MRPATWLLLSALSVLVACQPAPQGDPTVPATGSPPPVGTATSTPDGLASDAPPAATASDPLPTARPPGASGEPTATEAPAAACSQSDANRAFFAQAARAMSWPVYCAVLPDGWFVQAGSFHLANGGGLEVTYRGPADARLAIVEGNVCQGGDVEACAPRDAVIGPAAFGDLQGELGRLSTGLTLDVNRGAQPSWRATGLGLTEDAFRALSAAFLLVEG